MPEEVKDIQERVILFAVATQREEIETKDSLNELEELADTAGAVTVGKMIQNRDNIHPGTYLGKGKIEELREMAYNLGADTVICDDELSPAQLRNLEEMLGIKIIDRTILILDIFARHAHTREGILQVELAQLKYRLSRLTGLGRSLSRLGGGIGTRGPGEKKLETDRRYIRTRVGALNDEIEEISRHRDLLREGRAKQGKPTVAIVGYTNSGKSTLLNALTQANVLMENKLFATLDPTTRNMSLPEGKDVLMTDTVGFVRKLPHHLVKAFKSTLEEASYADLLIHVVDAANPQANRHMEVVYETLAQLGAGEKPVLTLFNKIDIEGANLELEDPKAFKTINTSVIENIGLDEMRRVLEEKLQEDKRLIKVIVPYDKGKILQIIRIYGQILAEVYENEGTYVEAYMDMETMERYCIEEETIKA